ncbi:hypothetical protein LINGRAHAP2_LOCUS23294 [Linum grandiflorum]
MSQSTQIEISILFFLSLIQYCNCMYKLVTSSSFCSSVVHRTLNSETLAFQIWESSFPSFSLGVQESRQAIVLQVLSVEREPEPIENELVQNNNGEQPFPPHGNPENPPQDVDVEPLLRATRCFKSDVWSHFTTLFIHGILKAQCKYCKKVLEGKSSNGTSHLRTHWNHCVAAKEMKMM